MLVSFCKMSLSWFEAWAYDSKVPPSGPWVSENHQGYMIAEKPIVSCVFQLLHPNNINEIGIEIKHLVW